jgi:hypothetical protein
VPQGRVTTVDLHQTSPSCCGIEPVGRAGTLTQITPGMPPTMMTRTVRRTIGAAAIVGGALLMWLSPAALYGYEAVAGGILMAAGIVLEIVGISLERRE